MRALIDQGYGANEVRRAIEGLASATGDPPRPPNTEQDVIDIYGDSFGGLDGGSEPVALEEGHPPHLSPEIISETLTKTPETIWGGADGGGINPLSINLSKFMDPMGSPRLRDDFLNRPGATEWFMGHAELPGISPKMLQAFINTPDGLRLLMEAYDQ